MKIRKGDWVRTKNGIIKMSSIESCIENVIKHSYNLIDLIDVGDVVNGQEIESKNGDTTLVTITNHGINKKHIKTILTKEQYKKYALEVEE